MPSKKPKKCEVAALIGKLLENEDEDPVDLTPVKTAISKLIHSTVVSNGEYTLAVKVVLKKGKSVPKGFHRITSIKKIK